MKIFVTLSYYKPHISGLTVCVQRLIGGLSKKDFKFTVLTSRHRNNLLKSQTENNVKIIRSPVLMTLGKVPVMPWYLSQVIMGVKESDLVWIHLPQAEGLIVAVVAKLFRKKVVTTVHCLPLLPNGWQRLLFQRLFDLLNNLTIRLADRVIYYTKDYAENTKELLHIPRKSSYILPPIPRAKGQGLRAEGKKNNKKLVVGFAGRIAEDKGLEYLLEALSLLKAENNNVDLVIAGNMNAVGEKNYSDKIKKLLQTINFKVEFAGEIRPENMSEFYRKIDLLVLPSVNRTESFGMVQAEAMLSGVTVVASDLPGVRVAIKWTGSGRLFPVGDTVALARAMNEVLEWRWDRQDIINQAKKYFQLQKSLLRYEHILRRTNNQLMDY